MATASSIHREIIEGWNTRNWDKLRGLLHPDYSYTGSDGKEHTGPEAGMQVAKMYADAFSDGRLELKRLHTQGDVAIAEMVARGTHGGELMGIAATQRPVEINICNVMELRDGKVYREREYMDMLTLMSQIGVYTAPGKTRGA
jgi:steroid delta-isomerase-like uncharacterized protein